MSGKRAKQLRRNARNAEGDGEGMSEKGPMTGRELCDIGDDGNLTIALGKKMPDGSYPLIIEVDELDSAPDWVRTLLSTVTPTWKTGGVEGGYVALFTSARQMKTKHFDWGSIIGNGTYSMSVSQENS